MTDYEQHLSEQWDTAKACAEHHEACAAELAGSTNSLAPPMLKYHNEWAASWRAEMRRILERRPRDGQKEAA